MKKWVIIGLIILAASILLVIFSYDTIILALDRDIPNQVSSEYNNLKSQYSCSYCFTTIQVCKNSNENQIYVAEGGSHQGSGTDKYFDNNGQFICNSKWSFSACKGGCPEDFYKGCPEIKECKIIVEWKGNDLS